MIFLGHCSFTQLFPDSEKLKRKPKIFVKVIRSFWYVQHVGLIFQTSTRSSQSYNFSKIIQCKKNPSIKILRYIFFSTLYNTYGYCHVSFSTVDIIISKEEKIFGPKILMMVTKIFFLSEGLAVWRLNRNQFEQKLSKITLH